MAKKIIDQKLERKKQQKELFKELIPLVKAFLVWIVVVLIVAWDYTSNRWFSMLFVDFTTYLTWALAKIMFIPVQILGAGKSLVTTLEVNYTSIVVNNYPMLIELECSAYHAYAALLSLVAFSAWQPKMKFAAGGILFIILAVVNSLRIVLLGVVGHKYPQVFNVMHDYVWNILLVIVIWGMWEYTNRIILKKFTKNE